MSKTLVIKGVPDDIHEGITKLADRERRSVAKQVIVLLEQAVRDQVRAEARAKAALDGQP